MVAPLRPIGEPDRIAALQSYDMLDTLPEQALDDITELAAQICGAPICLISLVDEERQWFKSKVGVTMDETPRDVSFCGHTILQPELFIVKDATTDERFTDNPLVTGAMGIRFYVGAPLTTSSGQTIGALCIMDHVVRDLSESQQNALRILSRQVMAQFEVRRQSRALQEREANLLQVVRGCPVAISVHCWSDRTFVDVNPAFTDLVGWLDVELIGYPTDKFGIVTPDTAAYMRGRLANGHSIRDQELTVTTRGGELRQIILGAELLDLRGELHVVTSFVDITERKRQEEARRIANTRYRALFDYAPDGIVIADGKGQYLDANASMCRMLGYPPEEFIGLSAVDITIPAEKEHIGAALRTINERGDYQREWKFRRKDGSTFPGDVIATVMPDGNLLAMIRDVTERNRTEARFRRLVDSNAQGVMFWNLEGRVMGANDAFLRIVGYTRDDLDSGRIDWPAMTPAEFKEAERKCVEEIVAHGVCTPFEAAYLRKDGSRVPVLVGAAAFEDNPTEGVTFILDLSERNKLEQQFFRAQRMESIGTLAGGIAHDLNNVLTPILMSIQFLKEDITEPHLIECLDTVQESAERGAALVKQVLSFARGMDGRRIRIDLLHLVQDLLRMMRDTLPKSIQMRFSAANDVWDVTGDPTQVHQVFLNLCVNARDAMPDGGTLTIAMENVVIDDVYAAANSDSPAGDYVRVTVGDTGTGISSAVKDRMFEPFFTTKRVGEGTGLGLSTVLAILRSQGGFVKVSSGAGKGTQFYVYMAATRTLAVEGEVTARAPRLRRGNGELILVVDDDVGIRSITRAALERYGYRVLLASNGAEAVALYAKRGEEIAVVLTDMMMPVMDGPATIVALKAIDPTVKIIGSSGLASSYGSVSAVDAGVQSFVPKPYTADEILETLHRVLNAADAPSAHAS